MEALCSIFTAAFVAANLHFPSVSAMMIERCQGEVVEITGVPSGWGSIVTCPKTCTEDPGECAK